MNMHVWKIIQKCQQTHQMASRLCSVYVGGCPLSRLHRHVHEVQGTKGSKGQIWIWDKSNKELYETLYWRVAFIFKFINMWLSEYLTLPYNTGYLYTEVRTSYFHMGRSLAVLFDHENGHPSDRLHPLGLYWSFLYPNTVTTILLLEMSTSSPNFSLYGFTLENLSAAKRAWQVSLPK